MKKNILLLFLLFPAFLFSQRLPTDAMVFPVSSQSNLNTGFAFLDIQLAGTSSFWLARTTYVIDSYSNKPYGNVIIERRKNSDFTLIDSLEITGKAIIGNMQSDDEGNLYIVGRYRDSIRFDANNIFYTAANYTAFAIKVDTNMQIQWINPSIDGFFITVSPNGNNVFVRGDLNGMGGNVNIHRLDSSGNIAQTKLLSNIGYLSNIKTSNTGEIYFSGGCLGDNFYLDTIFISSSFQYDMYYGKLSSSLQAEWIRLMDDFTCEDIVIDIDDAGNANFFGPLNKTIILDTFQASPNLSKDFLLASLIPTGRAKYVKSAPANYRIEPTNYRGMNIQNDKVAILLEQDPNYNINWGNGLFTSTIGHDREQLILEYNTSTGNIVSASLFKTLDTERLRSILYLPNGDILTTGMMHWVELHTSTDTLYGSSDHLFIERWEMPTITSLNEHETAAKLSFYPNPSNGEFRFSESISGVVYDLAGKEILFIENQNIINLTGFDNGVYFLKTEKGGKFKLLKN